MSSDDVVIRPLAIDDRTQWSELWKGYQRFYKVDLPASTDDTTLARLLDPAEPMFCLVADAGTKLLGIVHFIFHRSTWTPGNYCYLQDLFTSEAARGKGVGRALIAAVVARAKADGASRVHWLTHETNTQAMVLYDQMAERPGFVQYRIII